MESRRTALYLIDERKAGSMAGRISSTNRPILAPALIIYAPQFRLMDFDFESRFRRRFISSRKHNRQFLYENSRNDARSVSRRPIGSNSSSSLDRRFRKMGHAWKIFFPPERIRKKQEGWRRVRLIFHIKSVQREFSREKQSRALVSIVHRGVEREAEGDCWATNPIGNFFAIKIPSRGMDAPSAFKS